MRLQSLSLLVLLTVSLNHVWAEEASPVRIDSEWDTLFTRSDGWTGADVGGTVDLRDGRTLWVFGDTWIGKVQDNKHVPGARMVNNSAAIHPHDAANPSRPPENMQFLWGEPDAEGHPTAWIRPLEQREPQQKSWYWTTGAGVVVKSKSKPPKLHVFLFRVTTSEAGQGIWKFRVVGTTLATFDDVTKPVSEWKPKLVDIPHSVGTNGGNRPIDQNVRENTKPLSWGTAVLRHPEARTDYAYLYGIRKENPLQDDVYLVRVPLEQIDDFSAWEFRTASDSWTKRLEDASFVAKNAASEHSVEWHHMGGRSRCVMVHSEPVLNNGICIRLADHPAGPWSDAHIVHRANDRPNDKRYFAYAAKGHAHLSQPDELLVTYIVNSHDFGQMFRDAGVYRPRAIRVNLKSLLK